MSEHQTPEQRASNVCRRLADAPIVDPSDYLAPQAIIAAAIREATDAWRLLADEALMLVDASAPFHADRAHMWEEKRRELRDRQHQLIGGGRAER